MDMLRILAVAIIILWGAVSHAETVSNITVQRVIASNVVVVTAPPGEWQVTLLGVCPVTITGAGRDLAYQQSLLREGILALVRGPLRLEYVPGPTASSVLGTLWDGSMNVNRLITDWLNEQRYSCASP